MREEEQAGVRAVVSENLRKAAHKSLGREVLVDGEGVLRSRRDVPSNRPSRSGQPRTELQRALFERESCSAPPSKDKPLTPLRQSCAEVLGQLRARSNDLPSDLAMMLCEPLCTGSAFVIYDVAFARDQERRDSGKGGQSRTAVLSLRWAWCKHRLRERRTSRWC